jgi:hypothetical protein
MHGTISGSRELAFVSGAGETIQLIRRSENSEFGCNYGPMTFIGVKDEQG